MKKSKSHPVHSTLVENEVSRTRKKKDALTLQKLGERLVALNDAQLAGFELSAELRHAITAARTMKSHGAHRRQLQYIGTLMRQTDPGPIQQKLESMAQGHSREVRRFKLIEKWRDELLDGDTERLQWLINTYPCLERARLTAMVDEALDPTIPAHLRRKQARALFRYLGQCSTE